MKKEKGCSHINGKAMRKMSGLLLGVFLAFQFGCDPPEEVPQEKTQTAPLFSSSHNWEKKPSGFGQTGTLRIQFKPVVQPSSESKTESEKNRSLEENEDLASQYDLEVKIVMSCCQTPVTSHQVSLLPLEEKGSLSYEISGIEFPRIGNWVITASLINQQEKKEVGNATISYNYLGQE